MRPECTARGAAPGSELRHPYRHTPDARRLLGSRTVRGLTRTSSLPPHPKVGSRVDAPLARTLAGCVAEPMSLHPEGCAPEGARVMGGRTAGASVDHGSRSFGKPFGIWSRARQTSLHRDGLDRSPIGDPQITEPARAGDAVGIRTAQVSHEIAGLRSTPKCAGDTGVSLPKRTGARVGRLEPKLAALPPCRH
jgi:hypothetical protein